MGLQQKRNHLLLSVCIFLTELYSLLNLDQCIKIEFVFYEHFIDEIQGVNQVTFDKSIFLADIDKLFNGSITVHLDSRLEFEITKEFLDFNDGLRRLSLLQ